MKTLDHNEEWQPLAPVLHSLPKTDPFKVREGFFEHFPHQVQSLVAKPMASTPSIWRKRWTVALPMVAVVAVAVHLLRPREQKATPMDITPAEAAQLLQNGTTSTQDILASAGDANWPDLGSVTLQLSPDEAAAYVDRENIDITDLINEP